MARPTLAPVRRAQIIEAATTIVAQVGLRATTLEQIAEASGLSRSHIRHYLGNRSEIMRAVWAPAIDPYLLELRRLDDPRDPAGSLRAIVDFHFGPLFHSSDDDFILGAMLNGAGEDELLQGSVHDAYREMVSVIASLIVLNDPRIAAADAEQRAFDLLCLVIGTSRLSRLPFDPSLREGSRRQGLAIVGVADR